MSLKERLAREIALTGPMTVADYVTRCLHDPQGGYYATRPSIGATGGRFHARQISQAPTSIIGIDSIIPMVRPSGRFSMPKSGCRTVSSEARTRP